eukprot:354157-Chlamydomonas_euryale.AAC.9
MTQGATAGAPSSVVRGARAARPRPTPIPAAAPNAVAAEDAAAAVAAAALLLRACVGGRAGPLRAPGATPRHSATRRTDAAKPRCKGPKIFDPGTAIATAHLCLCIRIRAFSFAAEAAVAAPPERLCLLRSHSSGDKACPTPCLQHEQQQARRSLAAGGRQRRESCRHRCSRDIGAPQMSGAGRRAALQLQLLRWRRLHSAPRAVSLSLSPRRLGECVVDPGLTAARISRALAGVLQDELRHAWQQGGAARRPGLLDCGGREAGGGAVSCAPLFASGHQALQSGSHCVHAMPPLLAPSHSAA